MKTHVAFDSLKNKLLWDAYRLNIGKLHLRFLLNVGSTVYILGHIKGISCSYSPTFDLDNTEQQAQAC